MDFCSVHFAAQNSKRLDNTIEAGPTSPVKPIVVEQILAQVKSGYVVKSPAPIAKFQVIKSTWLFVLSDKNHFLLTFSNVSLQAITHHVLSD